MAYKDEYEVARLFADPRFAARLRDGFEGDFALRFHLAPPLFERRDPDTGLPVKHEFGRWMMGAMRLLAAGKVLRGTPLDPFGHTFERRTEQRLIVDYESVVDELTGGLDADNHALAVEIACVPEKIRGFGHVKVRHLAEAKRCEADLLAAWRRCMPAASAA
jgi:indolepyruvate ferredoxin oxidoreductase